VVRIVPDDAFYYFQTARHIVAGNGSTFDGTYPANGYHPVWMILVLPIAVFASDPLSLVRVALGHGFKTPYYTRKVAEVAAFYGNGMTEAVRRDLLAKYNVRHVWRGPDERALGTFDPNPGCQRHGSRAVQAFARGSG